MASKMPQITIIGAGLSGLALGLGLRSKGITAVLYDRAASAPRYNYGVTLYPSTYRPLLGLLDMDEAAFRETLSVNTQQQQQQQQQSVGAGTIPGSNAFRCHRGRLEALLRRSLSIKWDKKLKEVMASPGSRDITAVFEDGEQHKTTCLIGCDGPHSTTRQILAPGMKLEVLPYVTFNGKRRMSAEEYADKFHEHMQGHAIRQTRVKDVLLEVSVANIDGPRVELSYVYSRPARAAGDPLHHPDRPLSGVIDVPEEFYDELGNLADLEMPFKEIFAADKVREDRTLHWLMRCL